MRDPLCSAGQESHQDSGSPRSGAAPGHCRSHPAAWEEEGRAMGQGDSSQGGPAAGPKLGARSLRACPSHAGEQRGGQGEHSDSWGALSPRPGAAAGRWASGGCHTGNLSGHLSSLHAGLFGPRGLGLPTPLEPGGPPRTGLGASLTSTSQAPALPLLLQEPVCLLCPHCSAPQLSPHLLPGALSHPFPARPSRPLSPHGPNAPPLPGRELLCSGSPAPAWMLTCVCSRY